MTGPLLITASGYWNPLVWLAAFAIILVIVLIIRSSGTKRFKKGTDQTLQFFSGNRPPADNVDKDNLYWGFSRKLERYTAWLRSWHTGIVNDYAFAFAVLIIIIFAALAFGGVL